MWATLVSRKARCQPLTCGQFVPFQRFRGDSIQLTAEVLAEVPDQVVRYMADNNIAPRAPLPPPMLSAASFAASSAPPLTPTSVTPTSAASVPAASFASFVPPPPPPAQALPPLPPGMLLFLHLRLKLLYISHRME
jgi:hypothetical protein